MNQYPYFNSSLILIHYLREKSRISMYLFSINIDPYVRVFV